MIDYLDEKACQIHVTTFRPSAALLDGKDGMNGEKLEQQQFAMLSNRKSLDTFRKVLNLVLLCSSDNVDIEIS